MVAVDYSIVSVPLGLEFDQAALLVGARASPLSLASAILTRKI